ncbi:MAG: HD domain-containing protein, partial [Deltaproteobacteria bacterium]|nr:HD domain-containing protein [Deltaproteobacteria bacterium]
HPTIGANIIGHLCLLSEEQLIIRHHHERWDGSGYPDGLKGNAIPLLSRILAVADVYHAMASDRAYRKRVPAAVIVGTIRKGSGTQFDQAVVEAFLAAYARGRFSENRRIKITGLRKYEQSQHLFAFHNVHILPPSKGVSAS